MKKLIEIENRISKLKARNKRKYLSDNTSKLPHNCSFNHEYIPKPLSYGKEYEFEIAPRKSNSLVIIQEDLPVKICMYGSDSSKWNGDICDDETVSSPCPFFKPVHSEEELGKEYEENTLNNEYVYENYPEVAALQWILDNEPIEIYSIKQHFISLYLFLFNWFKYWIK